MRKKYRNITVDGVKYAWALVHYDLTCVNIWRDRKLFIEKREIREFPITPLIISKIIKDFCNI